MGKKLRGVSIGGLAVVGLGGIGGLTLGGIGIPSKRDIEV